MYDLPKVILGLVLFFGVFTLPFWVSFGDSEKKPELVIKAGVEACVESKEYMIPNHMQLLDEWRHSVVRESKRVYTSSTGVKFEKSLTNTCLDCHSNKEEFCDRCHEYADVKPFCWTCHIVPEEKI